MKNLISLVFISFLPFLASASPQLDLIKDIEWKGECRKVVNESGHEIHTMPYVRLQSSYSWRKEELMWWVSSFKEPTCDKLNALTSSSVFKCQFTSKDEWAICNQTNAGNPSDAISMKVHVNKVNSKAVDITTIGEDGDPQTETLGH